MRHPHREVLDLTMGTPAPVDTGASKQETVSDADAKLGFHALQEKQAAEKKAKKMAALKKLGKVSRSATFVRVCASGACETATLRVFGRPSKKRSPSRRTSSCSKSYRRPSPR